MDTNGFGKKGETLVKRLFEDLDWEVANLGVEHHFHGLPFEKHNDITRGAWTLPDLAIRDPSTKTARIFLVEVKTWNITSMDPDRLKRHLKSYHHYGKVLIIWVSPMGLQAGWLDGNKKNPWNGFQDFRYLKGFWKQDRIVEKYDEAAKQLFAGV